MSASYINPDSLPQNPAFTTLISESSNAKTIYISGQDAVDAEGAIVGKGDFKAQLEQILQNMQAALAAAGAKLEHIIKWNIYLVQGQKIQDGLEIFQRVLGKREKAPTINVVIVSGFENPDFLAEMDAIAVIPE